MRLADLGYYRDKAAALEEALDSDQAADEKERALWQKELELARREIQLLERQIDITERERDFYRQSLDAATKKKGKSVGCVLKKIFTLGFASC